MRFCKHVCAALKGGKLWHRHLSLCPVCPFLRYQKQRKLYEERTEVVSSHAPQRFCNVLESLVVEKMPPLHFFRCDDWHPSSPDFWPTIVNIFSSSTHAMSVGLRQGGRPKTLIWMQCVPDIFPSFPPLTAEADLVGSGHDADLMVSAAMESKVEACSNLQHCMK